MPAGPPPYRICILPFAPGFQSTEKVAASSPDSRKVAVHAEKVTATVGWVKVLKE